MLALWPAVLLAELGAADPHLTLVLEVEPEVCVAEALVTEELRPRLPEMALVSGASAGDAIGYRLGLRATTESPGTAGVALELLDPLGSPLLDQTLACDDDPRRLARESAVLVEGRVRLHMQRFGRLLAVIRDSDARRNTADAAAAPAPPPARGRPLGRVSIALCGGADLRTFAPGAGIAVGAELAIWSHLALGAGVSAALPIAWQRPAGTFTVQETALDLSGRVILWPERPRVFIDLGYVLYLVGSGSRSTPASSLDAYSGLHGLAGASYPLSARWALHGGARVDLLPRFPSISWRGLPVVRRGPWRGAVQGGVELAF